MADKYTEEIIRHLTLAIMAYLNSIGRSGDYYQIEAQITALLRRLESADQATAQIALDKVKASEIG